MHHSLNRAFHGGFLLKNNLRGYHGYHSENNTTTSLGCDVHEETPQHVEIFKLTCALDLRKRFYQGFTYHWCTLRGLREESVIDCYFLGGVVGALVHSSYPIPSWDLYVYLQLVDFYGIKAEHNIHGLMV